MVCCSKKILVVVGVGVVVRMVLGVVHPFMFPDSWDYDALARAMVEHRAYEVNGLYASRMPGYPGLVAGVYFLCGYSVRAVAVLQAFLGGAAVYLTWAIGRRFHPGVGLAAAVVLAVGPLSVAFSAALLTETAFTFLLVLGIYLGVRLLERARWGWWVGMAVVWAGAVELRPAVMWCIVPVGVVLVIFSRTWRERGVHVAGVVVTLLVVQATVIPWRERCDAVISRQEVAAESGKGARVHFTTLEGTSLYEAVYPGATGGPRQEFIEVPAEMKGMNEAQRNREWSRRAWGFIWGDPGRIAWLGVRKVGRTWSPVLNAGEFQNWVLQAGLAVWNIPMFLLGLYGLFRGGLPLKVKLLLMAPVVYFTAVHALFLGSVRYRVPLMPVVGLLAAAGVVELVRRRKRGKLVSAGVV